MAERLGELLVQLGALRPEDLGRALRTQQESSGRLGGVLLSMGLIDEDTLLKALARQKRVPFAEARWFESLEPRILKLVSRAVAIRLMVVPLRLMDRRLVVATCDADDLERTGELADHIGQPVRPVLARRVDVERALIKYYQAANGQSVTTDKEEVQLLVRKKPPGSRTGSFTATGPPPAPLPPPSMTPPPSLLAVPRGSGAWGMISAEEDAELRELFASADEPVAAPGQSMSSAPTIAPRPIPVLDHPVADGALAFTEDARTTLDLRPPPGIPKPPPRATRPPQRTTGEMSNPGLRARAAPPPPPQDTPSPFDVSAAAGFAVDTQPVVMPPQDMQEAAAEAAARDSTRFGPYTLLKRIKAGGMAEVFLAKTSGAEGFEKRVAIKRILPHLTESGEFVDMFIDEAKLTVQLNHANIASILDFGKRDGMYYIALEFIHGKDVNAIFRESYRRRMPLPFSVCCFIVQQACEGLDYAHRKKGQDGRDLGIVHRDISPANILVSYEGAVKIIDFGIAKAVSKLSMTRPGLIKGKISYMSPEQMRGQPIDRRSDVFAAGIILYELLTGRRLFAARTDVDTIRNVIKGNIPSLENVRPDIPPALTAIVMKALEREVEQRYGWAADLSVDLQSFLLSHGYKDARGDMVRYMDEVMRDAE